MGNKYPRTKKCPYCNQAMMYLYTKYNCCTPNCPGRKLKDEQLKTEKSKSGQLYKQRNKR